VSRRLHITTVRAARFGGFSERGVELPDDPFVVLRGRNEAGKTSLAELVAWLLAGPTGPAEWAQRFGSVDDRVGGTLTARLGGRPVELTGSFRVPAKGPPNDRGLSADLDGPLDAAGWRARIGGVDATVLRAYYRLWGEDLHDGGDAAGELSRVALGALGGRIDARGLADELTRAARERRSGKAAGVVSVTRRRAELAELDGELAVASRNAEDHRALVGRIGAVDEERTRAIVRRDAARARVVRLERALLAHAHRTELDAATAALAALPAVPAAWTAVLADRPALEQALAALTAAEAHHVAAADDAAHLVAASGRSEAGLVGIDTAPERHDELVRATSVVDQCEEATAEAQRQLDGCRDALAAATREVDGAIADLGGDRDRLARSRLDADASTRLTERLARCRAASDRVAALEGDLGRATDAARAADSQRRAAEDAWGRWGLDTDAQAWLARPRAEPAAPGGLRWLPPALAVVPAAVALAVGQWLIAAVTLAVAVVLAAIAVLTRPRGSAGVGDPTAIHESAAAVMAQRASAAQADAARAAVAAQVEAVAHELDGQRRGLDELAAEMGVRLPPDLDAADGVLGAWRRVQDLLAAERRAQSAVATAVAAHERARERSIAAMAHLGELTRAAGLPADLPPGSVVAAAQRGRAAAVALGARDRAAVEVRDTGAALARRLAPVAAEVQGWSPDRIAARVAELTELTAARAAAEQRVEAGRVTLAAAVGEDPEVASLLDSGAHRADLEALLADAREVEADADAEAARLAAEAGSLARERDELGRADRIAELRLRRGGLVEHQRTLLLDAVAHLLAADLLRTVAEAYEREHQPALVTRTSELARAVADHWREVTVVPAADRAQIVVRQTDGTSLDAHQLSTGARALLYLALRLAMADHDADQRGVALPLLCDDPLVHLDDERAHRAVGLLADAATRRQVLLFTCHARSADAARAAGAAVVDLDRPAPGSA